MFAAGIVGAWGVILAAVAAHLKSDPLIVTASHMFIFHACALLSLAAWNGAYPIKTRIFDYAAYMMLTGVILFGGDLCLRAFYNFTIFHNAAPLGGALIILGWVLISYAAIYEWIKSYTH
ncbi:MAG: DUF423 domain-containing protein [Hyphomicrobium sp.]